MPDTPLRPTLAGFQTWAQIVMGITDKILPPSNPVWYYAFTIAMNVVDVTWCSVSPTIYNVMVYNVAANNLLYWAQDPVGAPVFKNSLPYFEYWRGLWNLWGPISGVVSGANDQGTGTTLEVPDALKNLTLEDLLLYKTPYGRQYLAYAQQQGSLWGVS